MNSSHLEQPIVQPISKLLLRVLVFEFVLLAVFVWRGAVPIIAVAGLLGFAALLYLLYLNSLYGALLLMFSILPGPITVMKVAGKTPSFLFLDIVLLLVVVVMIVRWLMEWDGTINMHPIAVNFLLFLCWGGITAFQAIDTLRAAAIIRSYFSGLVAFLLVYKAVQTDKDVRTIYVALLIWGIALSLMEFYSLSQHGGFTLGLVGTFFSKKIVATSWGNSNYLAAFDVLLIPIAMAVFFARVSRTLKYLTILSLALMATALIVSLSRGGLIACFIAVLIVIVRFIGIRTLLPILAIVALIGLMVLLNPLTFVLIERILSFEQSGSFYTRIGGWQEAWRIFLAHPLAGVGLNNLGYYTTFIAVERISAHSIVLGLLSEVGIIGFFLFTSLIFTALRAVVRSLRNAKNDLMKHLTWGVLCSLLGVLFHAMLEPNFEGYQFSVMVWAIIGMAAKLPYFASDATVSEAVSQTKL